MNRSPRLAVILAFGMVVGLCCPAVATLQTSGGSRAGDAIELDFPGGTLSTYINAIQAAAGGVNIVLMSAAASNIELPPLQLNAVSAGDALKLIEGEHRVDQLTVVRLKTRRIDASGPGLKPILRVFAEWPSPSNSDVKVWSVLDLFCDEMKPEDVLTAVETAVELLNDDENKVQVQFHAATGVLIARGTPRQVNTIGDVLSELRGHMVLKGVFDGLEQAAAAAPLEPSSALEQMLGELKEIKSRLKVLERRDRNRDSE